MGGCSSCGPWLFKPQRARPTQSHGRTPDLQWDSEEGLDLKSSDVLLAVAPGCAPQNSGTAEQKVCEAHNGAELVEVVVHALSGNTITKLQLAPMQHVAVVKQSAQASIGVWADEQRLVWKDEILPDDSTLAACGLTEDICHVTLVHTPAQFVLAGRTDGILTLLDISKNNSVQHFPRAHAQRILSVVVDWPSRQALTTGIDKLFAIWDLASGAPAQICNGFSGSMHAVAVDWELRRVLGGFSNGSVVLFNLEDPHGCETQLGNHKGCVTSAEADWRAMRALTASYDRTLILWDLESAKALCSLEGHRGVIMGVALGWCAGLAMSCAADAALLLWDLSSGSIVSEMRGHTGTVRDLDVDWVRCRALSASSDKSVGLWSFEATLVDTEPVESDLRSNDFLFPWETPAVREAVAASPRRECRLVTMLRGHNGQVNTIRANWTSLIAMSAADDGELIVWDLIKYRALRSLWVPGNAEVTAMSIKSDAFLRESFVQGDEGQCEICSDHLQLL